jgi:hypothetical protein
MSKLGGDLRSIGEDVRVPRLVRTVLAVDEFGGGVGQAQEVEHLVEHARWVVSKDLVANLEIASRQRGGPLGAFIIFEPKLGGSRRVVRSPVLPPTVGGVPKGRHHVARISDYVQELRLRTQIIDQVDAEAVGWRFLEHQPGAWLHCQSPGQESVYQETLAGDKVLGAKNGRQSDNSLIDLAEGRKLPEGSGESLLLPRPAKVLRQKVQIEQAGFLRGSNMRAARDESL